MNKTLVGCGSALGIFVLLAIIIAMGAITINNAEVDLRTAIEAKQKDNTSEYDNCWKKISQVAQVTDAQKEALRQIFTDHAQARTPAGDKGAIFKWIKESVPSIDTSTFNQLQGTITASRDRWTMRQKELVDLSREHNALLQRFPSNLVLGLLGRKSVPIVLVTSSKTAQAFTTGCDDDVTVFNAIKPISTTTSVTAEKLQ